MTGTWINIASVIGGGSLGLLFGSQLPERIRGTVVSAIGLFTLAMGVRMFLEGENPLFSLGSLLLGGILGEWLGIEAALQGLGRWLESRFSKPVELGGESPFVKGFLSASLLFCVGPMTIIGSIQDGLSGDFSLLAIKSVLDGFAALALASTLGLGVLFSALIILLYQGGLSLMAAQAQTILSSTMIAEMTAVGGVLLLGLSIGSLLEIREIRTGNLIPALAFAPLLVAIVEGVAGFLA